MMGDAAAVMVVATILSDYLPTELATRISAAGLPAQSVAAVATGRHIQAELVGQVGVWCEDSETVQQHLGVDGWEYRDTRIIVEATVSALDLTKLDQVRSVWADSIRACVERRFRVHSDAGFYALKREETLDALSSARTTNSIRGAIASVLQAIKQPPCVDQIRLRFVFGQRVSTITDIV